jgi:hypothetical protein
VLILFVWGDRRSAPRPKPVDSEASRA